MTPERLQQIEGIFHDALERNESEQLDFVRRVCGSDEELCREVLSLLEAHYLADQHATQPAMDLAAHELAAEQMHPSPFPELENYDVISPLGRGGMGEVLLAKDKRLKRKVALKLLPSYYARNPERLRRFEQEALTASALTHPNIMTVYEIGQTGDSYYIATEFVEGKTLRQRIAEGPLQVGEATAIALQITNALQAAHNAGIVHRDIKPDNIMIRPDGFVKILDFGIAKLTEPADHNRDVTTVAAGSVETATGQIIGTPAYLSPEQARGLKIDGRSDLFSLGVVLYEMLFGRKPFTGETAADVMVAILEKEPVLPANTNPALQHLLTKALQKKCEQRYQSAEDLAKDLRHIQQLSSHDTAGFATTQFDLYSPPRKRVWLPALLALVLVLGGFLAYRFWPTAPPAQPPQTFPPPVEVMQYSLEIAGDKGPSKFSNGSEALAAKQDFKFHFVSKRNGFLYMIAPGKTNLPETFLTAQPLKGSVKTNAITAGEEYKFPAEDEYWINLSNAHTTTFSVIFSPTPLTTPAFLAAPAGRKLTIVEQQEWDTFRQTIGVQQPTIITDQPRAVVTVPAEQADGKPVLFEVTVKLKEVTTKLK
ncbi:MAG TPA: serine/threonine-protein kinase [Blastocatellia bacterium]|nr:serine/threonine-protein kinase [Blastocatellia bacterium]